MARRYPAFDAARRVKAWRRKLAKVKANAIRDGVYAHPGAWGRINDALSKLSNDAHMHGQTIDWDGLNAERRQAMADAEAERSDLLHARVADAREAERDQTRGLTDYDRYLRRAKRNPETPAKLAPKIARWMKSAEAHGGKSPLGYVHFNSPTAGTIRARWPMVPYHQARNIADAYRYRDLRGRALSRYIRDALEMG